MGVLAPEEYIEKINRIASFLDEENIKILRAMKRHGPRNLQRISRKASLPYATVYTRVSRLEEGKLLKTWIHPNYSKLGLARSMVLLTPHAGQDLLAREATKIPGYWLRIIRCIGDCNGYYSLHAVPQGYRQDFERYFDHLVVSGLVQNYRVFWLDEAYSPIPNFDYHANGTWKFDWQGWTRKLVREEESDQMDPSNSETSSSMRDVGEHGFDEKDLVILSQLSKNARTKLSVLAGMINVTLPAVKYRFDNLIRKGMINDYVIDFLPYAPEISDLYEVRLDFKDSARMTSSLRFIPILPFVMTISNIRSANSITARMYLPHGEMENLIVFLSSLVREQVLSSYSLLILDPSTMQSQSFPIGTYKDEAGWLYDNRAYLAESRKLTSQEAEARMTIDPVTARQQIATII